MRAIALVLAGFSAVALAGVGTAHAGTRHIYSYDPADAETRLAAGPLTFEIDKPLIGAARVLDLRSTVADATADLARVDPRALGPDDPAAHLGDGIGAGGIYRVEGQDQGGALISALCPGSNRAWMAFSKPGFDRSLIIAVMGETPGATRAHLCHELSYDFHGEWRLPPSGRQMKARDILSGRYPGT